MPRQARLDTPGTLHHVIGKNRGQVLTLDKSLEVLDDKLG
jgi:hypothetical protein